MSSPILRGRAFGLTSGFTWAVYITALHFIMSPFNGHPVYATLCVAFVGMVLNEAFALVWLTMTHGKALYRAIVRHAKLMLKTGWLFFVFPFGMFFFVGALSLTDESTVAVGTAVYPISSLVIGRLALKRPLVRAEVFAVILCTIGLTLTAGTGFLNLQFDRGFLLALMCALCWGAEAVLCYRFVPDGVPHYLILAMRYSASCLLGIPVLFALWFMQPELMSQLLPWSSNFWILLPLCASISLTSCLCYVQAIQLLGPVRALTFNITYMIWVFIIAFATDQSPTVYTLAGAVFIGLSLLCSCLQSERETKKSVSCCNQLLTETP